MSMNFGEYGTDDALPKDIEYVLVNLNISEISELDIVGGREKHPCHIEANAGKYPLGLFAGVFRNYRKSLP